MMEGFTRRHSLGLIASTLALAACGQSDGRPVLKVGSQRGSSKALMQSSGVLEGASFAVEWSEFPAAQHILEAVGSGAVDLGIAADAPFQFAYHGGSPIKVVAAQRVEPRPREASALIVPAGSAARSLSDLRGRKIATGRGSIGHYLALRALDEAKLPFDAVQFTYLSPGDAKAAFSSGAVDGWSIWMPYLTSSLQEGAHIIVDGQDLLDSYAFEVANEGAIAGKRDLLADFLAREEKAMQWAVSNVDDFAIVLAKETRLPADIARAMAEKNSRVAVPINDKVIAGQRAVLDTFQRAGEVKNARPIEDAFAGI